MPTINIYILLLLVLFGCQNLTPDLRITHQNNITHVEEPNANQSVIGDNKICRITEDTNPCHIQKRIYQKLVQLSHSGNMTTAVLDLIEVQEKYKLNEDMIQCLKKNFCRNN